MATLYVVATPIGNLQDITLRALEVLKSVDLVVCEDTRVTRKLLSHFQIDKPLVSYHQHSDAKSLHKITMALSEGKDIAYVTDAGTPGIQDPGNQLVAMIVDMVDDVAVNIVPVPGVSAVVALASVSGLPTDSFVFLGFVPKKKGKQTMLQEIRDASRTVIFYESGHRILKTLEALRQAQGDNDSERRIIVGRELTKKFETIYRGPIAEVIEKLEKSSVKGEFAVAVEAAK